MGGTHTEPERAEKTPLIGMLSNGRRLLLLVGVAVISLLFAMEQQKKRDVEQKKLEAAWAHVPSDLYSGLAILPIQRPSPRIRLEGHPTLIVGDSMTYEWPFVADQLGYWGRTTSEIRAAFEEHIRDREYTHIVLWPGTAHLQQQHEPSTYVADVGAMVTLARNHSERVTLISPLLGGVKGERAAAVLSEVSESMPELEIVDILPWRAELVAQDKWDDCTTDGLHLSEYGLNRLAAHLVQTGMPPGGEAAAANANDPTATGWLAQLW